MKQSALLAIRLYRRYVSPYKGFSCAHRVLAGGESCSAYGYRVIERHGGTFGGALLRRRLRACAQMVERAPASSPPPPRYLPAGLRARRQAGDCDGCDAGCDAVQFCVELFDCSAGARARRRAGQGKWWKCWY